MYRTLLMFTAACLLFTGCQKNSQSALPDHKTDQKVEHVKNSSQHEQEKLSNRQIADHLSGVASNIPDVRQAYAVVAGPYAVVGIDVDKDLDRSRVGTIKYSVAEAMQHDPYGKTAVIVADGDVTQRLRNMSAKISQGYPVQGFVDELAAIVGRYMPETPVPHNRPQESDQNKKTIPEDEQKHLDDIQDEQSNHHK